MSNAYGEYKAPGGGGAYYKFEPGKTSKVRIASEPVVFNSEYEGNISTKYAWIVWDHDEEAAKVLQLPVTGFRMVQDLATNEDWGDPTTYDIKIKRDGTGRDTKYSIQPVPNSKPLSEEAQKACDSMNIMDFIKQGIWLSEAVKGKTPDNPVVQTFGKDVEIEDLSDEEMPPDFLKQ